MSVFPGLCARCLHIRVIHSDRGSTFYQCQLSFADARFPKYPRLPILDCCGWEEDRLPLSRASTSAGSFNQDMPHYITSKPKP